MDHQFGNTDLASLSATFDADMLKQVLGALQDQITIVDGDGHVITHAGAGISRPAFAPKLLGDAFVQGLTEVLSNRRDGFEHVVVDQAPELCARYRVLPLRSPRAIGVIGAVIVRHPLQDVTVANKRVSDILHHVANIVHDLRTELNAVIGFSDMMLKESWGKLGDDHYRHYAHHIHLSGSHLLHQVNQMLDLSRAEYLEARLEEEEVNLAELLHQCCQSLDILAERNGLAVTVSSKSVATIRADSRLTRRVVLNLLSNAIKFTPTGGQIAAMTGLDAHGRPFLSVRDTGIGIEAIHLDKVMQPFAQIDSPQGRLHRDNGTGLGLPLSKRLMELHGGSLALHSAPNQGTTVTAWFPKQRMISVSQVPN